MRVRTLASAVVVAAVATFAAIAPAAAQAKFIDVTPDVPSGTQPHITPDQKAPVLPYNGGRVINSNRTHPVFWEPAGSGLTFDPGYESLIETFLTDVAADSYKTTNVYSLSGQYTDSDGPAAYDSTYGGAVVDNDPLPSNGCTEPTTGPGWTVCLTDAQLETELEHVIAADHLPTTSRDVFFIITPNGFGSCTDSSSSSCALGGSENGYCGYHSETSTGVVYAVIPYNAVPGHCQSSNPRPNSSTADPTISTVSHEHNEMDTDPDGNAWIDARGEEEADLCLTNFGPSLSGPGGTAWNESIHGGHFFLQEEWSNADGACEPRAKPDSVSFGQVPAPGHARSMSFTGRASAPDGGIVAFQWFFGDGRTAWGRRTSHTFKTPGTFRVRLRATDSWGNRGYAGRTIRVRGLPAG
ncbi:MAG: PKD domain-containing protein [Solirubrobacteraceae bacterium]